MKIGGLSSFVKEEIRTKGKTTIQVNREQMEKTIFGA